MNILSKERIAQILELIHKEVKPALGCTEPIAVSLAVARASEILRSCGCEPEEVEVRVSANILKNAMGVGIPGTGMVGLPVAAALAVTCGRSEYGLEVLKNLKNESVAAARKMEAAGKVKVVLEQTPLKLYIMAVCFGGGHKAEALVRDSHDNIAGEWLDGKSLRESNTLDGTAQIADNKDEKSTLDYQLDLRTIVDFALQVPLKDLEFIMEAVEMNTALAREGLSHDYGLRVGRTIESNVHKQVFGHGLLTHCIAMTAAASDARMAGCTLPAMSNSGSGNQGITVTMPVVAAAEHLHSTHEELVRALILSHLTAIHIKGYLGRLSALCGCVIASTGSACGIVMLSGGSFEQIGYAIQNMVGNITGMVCDGAKVGCALKVASGVSCAVQSAVLALDNICIGSTDGIIEKDVEKTIRNLGALGSKGMQTTDEMILDMMICK